MESHQSNGSAVDQHYAKLQATLTALVVARRHYHQAKHDLESSFRAGHASSQRTYILKCNYTDTVNAFTNRWEEFAAAMTEDQKFYPNNRSDFSFVSDIKDERDQALNADELCKQTTRGKFTPHDAHDDNDLTTYQPSSESNLAKETLLEDHKPRPKSQRAAGGNTETTIDFRDEANAMKPSRCLHGMSITSNPLDTTPPPRHQTLMHKWYPKYEVSSICETLRQSTTLLQWLAFAPQAVASLACGTVMQVRGTIWLLTGLLILHGLASGLYLLVQVLIKRLKSIDESRCRCLQWVFAATYALVSAFAAFAVVARTNAFSLETNLQICMALTCCIGAFQALLVAYHTMNNHNIQERKKDFQGSHRNL